MSVIFDMFFARPDTITYSDVSSCFFENRLSATSGAVLCCFLFKPMQKMHRSN